MKVIDIDPFIEASAFIFEQFQMDLESGEGIYAASSETDVIAMVGLTGDIRGQVLLRLPVQTGLKIVSAMMGGMEVPEMDQMSQSALLELTNMICGNALTILTDRGLSLNLTPPTLFIGKSMEVTGTEMDNISSIITINGTGAAEISVMYEK